MNNPILSDSDQVRRLKLQLQLAQAQTAAAIAERDIALMMPQVKANQKTNRHTIKGQIILALQNESLTAEDLALRISIDINALRVALTRAKHCDFVEPSRVSGNRKNLWKLTEKGIAEKMLLSS